MGRLIGTARFADGEIMKARSVSFTLRLAN